MKKGNATSVVSTSFSRLSRRYCYLGAVLLAVGFFGELPTWGAAVALVVGAAALLTGAIGFCAAWLPFEINTCPTKPSGKA